MNSTRRLVVIFGLMTGLLIGVLPSSADAATLKTAAMASAKTQKGAKYHLGRQGPYNKGYDCSGLVYWAYKKHHKILPRTAQGQYNKSHHISFKSLKPGDLVFIKDRHGHVFHVGIYIGRKHNAAWMVNANTGSYRGRKVVEAPIYEYTAGSPYAAYGRY